MIRLFYLFVGIHAVCEMGQYNDGDTCLNCPSGFHADRTDLTECLRCNAGTFQNAPASENCNQCPDGKYQPNKTATECFECTEYISYESECVDTCPEGSWPSGDTCAYCTAGRYSIGSSDTCSECETGKYKESPSPEPCETCPAGWESRDSRDACQQCLETQGVIQGKCETCPVGTFSSNSEVCLPCSKGKYQDVSGQSICKDCPGGRAVGLSGQNACEPCTAGRFATGGALECTTCELGTGTSQTGQDACDDCVGAQTVKGICTECAAGMFLTDKRCEFCPRGYISDAAATECRICASGQYADVNTCKECEGGLVTNIRNGAGSWKCCLSTECDDCVAGKFRVGDQCNTCPSGRVSKAGGTCHACIISEGEYTTDHLDDCDYCAEGQSSDGTQCTDCAAGKYEFKFECINCPRGWFSGGTRNPMCERCPVGKSTLDVSSVVDSDCTVQCTADQIVDSFGNCQQCDLGKYVNGRVCEACPLGTHKDERATIECTNCPQGFNTDSTGNIDCFACPPGQQCGCPWGQYGRQGTTCQNCPEGYSSSGGLECTACPLKTYQPQTGQGACLSCPPGTFGDTTATVKCKDCPSGQFQLFAGAGACEDCPRGRWGGGVQCTNCTAGKSTLQTGSTSDGKCEECPVGKMEKDRLCIDCYEGTYQNKTGSVVCDACPVDKWSSPGASDLSECFGTKGLTTYTFGSIEDSKEATSYKTLCELRANFVMVCPGCTCDADARNGFWAGPMCNECRRGFATRFCTSICPGYDGQHDSTICNGNGRCWFGRQGNGLCYCGGHHILDSSSENVFVDVQYCPAGKICPGYGVEKVPVTTYIPLYYLINYRQYTSFVLQMSKYTPERGHMWFKRFSPSKAFENTCAVCNSKYLDSALTEIGYWGKESEYIPFPTTAQTKNGFHGENCQYECAVCLNGGKCVHSPHPYRYSYTIENTFKEQSSAIYPTTTCLCSSNVYDAAHMCCPNGFQPYVYYGKRETIPYSRFTTVPYVTSVDNNIDLGYYRDIDLALEKGITVQYIEPDTGIIPVGVGTKIVEEGDEATFSLVGPYNKHVYHGTTKEICRACPGLFGKGVRAVGDFIETEQAAEDYWWNFPASAGSKKCQGQGVCDFYKQDKQIDVDFMGDINNYALLHRGRMCKSKSVSGFVSTNPDSGQDITTLEECVQYAQDNSALFVGWAPEFYMGGTLDDIYPTELGSESNAKLSAAGQALEGWVKNTVETTPVYSTLTGELPEPDTDSTYEVHPRLSKRCIAFQSCIELRPLKSTAYRAFNIYTVEKGRGDERLAAATFDRFDTCFTYTKNYDHDPDKVGRRQKFGLYLTQDYEQGDDPFLGGLCPKGYFCTQNSDGTGFKEACPIGYYQPLEGKTRSQRDTHCSRETSDVIFNRTEAPRPCQTNLATKSSNDYVDKVCLRCPRDSYAPEGSYECTQCPPGRVKKVSGEFDPSSIEIYNTPNIPKPYWYYIHNEGGTEADDCALVPPSVIHVPTANDKMFESSVDNQYLPVVSCPFGYSSQPGTYIIEDIWNMQNILMKDEDIMVEPYINIEGDKQVYESNIPCSCIPSNIVEKYVAPETAEDCAELNLKSGNGVLEARQGLWYGCLRFDQSLAAEFNNDLSKINNYPTEGVKYICQKVIRDQSLMEEFVSTYCYQCPGDAMTGPASSMCTTCTANLIKKNMKIGLQKLVTNSEARMYHCDASDEPIDYLNKNPSYKTLAQNEANVDCPMLTKNHTDVSVDIDYKKDIPSRYYLQTLEKTWPAQHVFGFIKDPLLPGDSVQLSITDCILACSTVFTKPGENYNISEGVRPVRVGYAKETEDRNYCLCNEAGGIQINSHPSGDVGSDSGCIDHGSYDLNLCRQTCKDDPTCNGVFVYHSDTEDGGKGRCCYKKSWTGMGASSTGDFVFMDDAPDAYPIAGETDKDDQSKDCYKVIQKYLTTIKDVHCIQKDSVNIVWYESVIIDDWAQDEFPLCGLCKPGKKYTGSACADCEAGTYTSDMIQSMKDVCINCPAGYFQENEGQAGCKECRPGQFQPNGGLSECYLCPTGWHQNDFQSTECKHCKQGRYQQFEGQSTCMLCERGYFEASTQNDSTCIEWKTVQNVQRCQNWTNVNNQPCDQCPQGYSQNERGKGRCKDCPTGWNQPSNAQLQCVECDPGRYQSQETQTTCIDCPKGYAQDKSKQPECNICAKNVTINLPFAGTPLEIDIHEYWSGDYQWEVLKCESSSSMVVHGDDFTGSQQFSQIMYRAIQADIAVRDAVTQEEKDAAAVLVAAAQAESATAQLAYDYEYKSCVWSETTAALRASDAAEYQENSGQQTCKACPDSNICRYDKPLDKCGPGHVMPAGVYTEACYFCDKSTYASPADQSACVECLSPSIIDGAHTSCTDCKAVDGKYPQPTGCGAAATSPACTSCMTCLPTEKVVDNACEKCPIDKPLRDTSDGTKCTTCESGKYWSGTDAGECVECPSAKAKIIKRSCPSCGPNGWKRHWYAKAKSGEDTKGSIQRDNSQGLKYKAPWQGCCWDTDDYVKAGGWIVTKPDMPGAIYSSAADDYIDIKLKKVGGSWIWNQKIKYNHDSERRCLGAGKIFYVEWEWTNTDGDGDFSVYVYNSIIYDAEPLSVNAAYQCGSFVTNCDNCATAKSKCESNLEDGDDIAEGW